MRKTRGISFVLACMAVILCLTLPSWLQTGKTALASSVFGESSLVASGANLGSYGQSTAARKLVRTSDGYLHCVYEGSDGANTQIYCAHSADGGVTWLREPITSDSHNQFNPSIAVDAGDDLHVVWDGKHAGS